MASAGDAVAAPVTRHRAAFWPASDGFCSRAAIGSSSSSFDSDLREFGAAGYC